MKITLTLLVLALSLTAQAAIIAGPVTNPSNGHTYYLLSSSTWTKAEAEAITLGGHLATIRNAAEDGWIYATFGSYRGALWIGLADLRKTRQYTWASGEPVTYANWSGGQPDNRPDDGGMELYAHIWPGAHTAPGQWNDYADGDTVLGFPLYGVAELIPSASTLLPLPIGSSIGQSAAPANLQFQVSTAIELTWLSDSDKSYQVQWTPSLTDPQWKNLGPRLKGTGKVLSMFDSTKEHPRAFYRLQIVP